MVMGTQPTPMRPRTYGAVVLGGNPRYLSVGPCTQCGAPDETGAHVCAYCRSPRSRGAHAELIEVTTLSDPHPVYVRANPIMQPEPDRR